MKSKLSRADFDTLKEMLVAEPLTTTAVEGGTVGPEGPAGADGAPGPQGPEGPQGIPGNDGAPGLQGAAGNDGAPGPAGADGAQGIQGIDGPAGADGVAGPPGQDSVVPGPAGADGNDGAPGAPGADGNDGAPGQQGIQGIQGIQGVQGDPGTALGAWPVGSVFIAVVSTSPAILLGGGTWVAFGAGRVLVGLDVGDASFDTAEETGGAKTHTLTAAEMPAHVHRERRHATTTGALSGPTTAPDTSSSNPQDWGTVDTGSAGGGGAHNNLQPYIVCYFWKRTA